MDTNAMVGKFYRFKPRSNWPLDAQITLPRDPLYYIHPAIVIGTTPVGLIQVVTTTTHPHLERGVDVYCPIGFPSDLVATAPLVKNPSDSATASWVRLDNRKTFSVDLFTPFMEPGGREQYALSKKSKRRLINLVADYEASCPRPPIPPTTAREPTAIPAPSKKATKKSIPGVHSIPKTLSTTAQVSGHAPSVASAKTSKKASKKTAKKARKKTSVNPTVALKKNKLDVQDIKTSISSLKLAFAALEALCEKLEASTASAQGISPALTGTDYSLAGTRGAKGGDASAAVTDGEGVKDVKVVVEDDAAAGRSKRARMQKWFNIFKLKTIA